MLVWFCSCPWSLYEVVFVPYVDVVSVMHDVRVTEMLVCATGEVWVVHVVQVFCLVQTTCDR